VEAFYLAPIEHTFHKPFITPVTSILSITFITLQGSVTNVLTSGTPITPFRCTTSVTSITLFQSVSTFVTLQGSVMNVMDVQDVIGVLHLFEMLVHPSGVIHLLHPLHFF
jgi:hypothetical protein